MHSSVKLGIALVLTACGGARKHAVDPAVHACETAAAPAGSAPRRLVATVAALDQAPRTDDHVALLHAMRALRDSLEQIAPERTAELARVRTMTQALERAVGNADAHADFVRIGLVSAWHALEASSGSARGRCTTTGLDAMIAASSRIAPERRLAAQYATVRAALHAAAVAVLAAERSTTIARRPAR
jgi:hypothetical protein